MYNWGGFTPWDHQKEIFDRSKDREAFALLMEMRTGKTPVVIHNAAYLKAQGEIDGLLIMSPNYVKSVWEEQFEEHAPDWLDYEFFVWEPTKKNEEFVLSWEPGDGLNILAMNEEALSTKRGLKVAEGFLKNHTAMFAIDESTSIKNHKAKRTKAVHRMRTLAPYRRILTGTPSPNKGPLDLWAQFYFLDPGILGFSNYYGFRNRYAMMGGFKGKEIVGYVDIDMINARMDRHSARVRRSDVRDMPPKLYQKLYVPMTRDQWKLYDGLKKTMLAEWENKDSEARRLEVRQILTQVLRLQQITGGFVPSDNVTGETTPAGTMKKFLAPEPVPGGNPKLDTMMDFISHAEEDEHIVIFGRFRAELAAIRDRLVEQYGEDAVVEFHGGVSNADKDTAKRRFTDEDDPARFFVANPTSARMGLDLSIAGVVIYYSNSHNLLDRIQSEDRTETVARESESTLYVDLVSTGTVDEAVLEALREKKKLSDKVVGDEPLSSWI